MYRPLRFLVVALAAIPAAAAAVDLFPFSEGVLRTYESVSTAGTTSYTTRFDGTEVVGGDSTHVLRFTGGPDDGLQQHWTETPEGDKLLHGWFRTDCQCGARYEPPILWIDAPLSLGKSWDSTTEVVGLGSVVLHFQVVDAGPVTVPAGTFEAFTVEWFTDEPPIPGKPGGFGPAGRWLPRAARARSDSESYADSAGLIRHAHGTTVESLQRIEAITGVRPATWTGTRRLYR